MTGKPNTRNRLLPLLFISGISLACMSGCKPNVISGDDQVVFSKFFGWLGHNTTTYAIPSSDGGYLISGSGMILGASLTTADAVLIKTDANGDDEWIKTYTSDSIGDAAEIANAVVQLSDGGFLLVGDITPQDEDKDVFLIRTDANGDQIWQMSWGSPDGDESGVNATETIDGRIAIVANSRDTTGETQVIFARFDMAATFIDSNSYYFPGEDYAVGIMQSSTMHYYITGNTNRWGNADYWLIKADSLGNEVWYTYFGTPEGIGNPNEDFAMSSAFLSDGILLTGYSIDPAGDKRLRILKSDYNGVKLWSYEDSTGTEGRAASQFTDGRIGIAGIRYTDADTTDLRIRILNADGSVSALPVGVIGYHKSYENPVSIISNPDFTLTIAGTSEYENNAMIWLSKLNPQNFGN